MLLLLLFIIKLTFSIPKDSIKRLLKYKVGICIVYPDFSTFNISNNHFFQALMNSIEGPFSLLTYSYSKYSLSDKSTLSRQLTNIIITRENKFLEHYRGNFSLESVSKEINQAFYSFVEILNESTLSDFKNDKNSLFLLTGPSIIKDYEDAAFLYKHTKARFGFLYQNSSEDFYTLCYIKNKHDVLRVYDRSVPIIQFIRSCKSQYSIKNTNNQNNNQYRLPKHAVQFVAISDDFSEDIRSAFEYINNSNYGNGIDFNVVSWKDAADLKKKCQIEKSESIFTFLIYSNFYRKKSDNCYVFQDMDFYSKELLYFFVSKTINGYINNYNINENETKISNSKFDLNISNLSPIELMESNFSDFVPSKNLAFVFIENRRSFSYTDAKAAFYSLFYEFNGKQSSSKSGTFVEFYRIEYRFDNFKIPSADSFPTFAIFEPFNNQAKVFNEIFSIENLRNWILKFVDVEEEKQKNLSEKVNKSSNKINRVPIVSKTKNDLNSLNKENINLNNDDKIFKKIQTRPKIYNIDQKSKERIDIKSEL